MTSQTEINRSPALNHNKEDVAKKCVEVSQLAVLAHKIGDKSLLNYISNVIASKS